MIFNWYKNSQLIHTTKELTHQDGQDIKGQHSQEIAYLRYLLSLGKTKDQMFKCFLEIKNGSASIFSNDPEQQTTMFNTRYSKAKKLGPLTEENADINQVCIYQEEIDYLNSLKAPLWVRQYWLGLLVWYKTIRKKYQVAIKDTKWHSWILSQCKNNYQLKRKSETLADWNRKNKFPVHISTFSYENKRGGYKYKASAVSVMLKWAKNEGTLISDHVELEHFTVLFQFLKPGTFVCAKCGQLYDSDKMNPNDLGLCTQCKKDHRREYYAEEKRKTRAKL